MGQRLAAAPPGARRTLSFGLSTAWWGARRVGSALLRTWRYYGEDHCGTYAAAIAYYSIFSLVPLALITLSVFGLIVDQDRIVDFVFDEVPLKETETVRENVVQITERARDASPAGLGLGVLVLLWSSSGIFTAVRRGLNAASHRKQHPSFIRGKAIDLLLVPIAGLLILFAVAASTVAQIIIERTDQVGPINLDPRAQTRLASYAIGGVVSFVGFLLLYRFLPRHRPDWREALRGACFATVLFEAFRNGYAMLFSLLPFTRDTAIYTGLGTALTFLLWVFVNASILLLGAEFARATATGARMDSPARGFWRPFR